MVGKCDLLSESGLALLKGRQMKIVPVKAWYENGSHYSLVALTGSGLNSLHKVVQPPDKIQEVRDAIFQPLHGCRCAPVVGDSMDRSP